MYPKYNQFNNNNKLVSAGRQISLNYSKR